MQIGSRTLYLQIDANVHREHSQIDLQRAVMDRSSRPGPESTTLEAVGDQWRYALVVVRAGNDLRLLDRTAEKNGRK